MAVQLNRRRFTVDDYYKMAEAGILQPDDRVELLDGEIVQRSPIGPLHADGVDRVTRTFVRRVGDAAIVRVQNPIRLGEDSEPEPDVALLRPRPQGYRRAHPTPRDILLVVEVSDTTLALDRQLKLRLYAGAAVPETWIFNLAAGGKAGARKQREAVIEVYRRPGPDGYAEVRVLRRGDRIAPLLLPDIEFTVEELLDGA